MSRRPVRGVLMAVVASLVLAGCASVPTSGSVESVSEPRSDDSGGGVPAIDPQPPVAGSSPAEVVRGFLDALQASPVSTTVARRYLTPAARAGWRPEQGTIVYDGRVEPADDASGVVAVRLVGADRFDSLGRWRGPLGASASDVRLRVVESEGEYRIANPPNALVVSRSWFAARYTPASLYFFDPGGRVLVPEPVYAPVGDARAGALVRGLLAGPSAATADVERSYLPAGLQVALSVPVSDDGRATVSLKGRPATLTQQQAALLFAQIAWTLRQDRSITSVSVSIDGVPVRGDESGDSRPVDDAAGFDATTTASSVLYGVRGGLLVSGGRDGLDAVDGPFGSVRLLRSAAVEASSAQAAGVSLDGTRLLLGPVSLGTRARIRTLLEGAGDLTTPAWDGQGRLWVADRSRPGRLLVDRTRGEEQPTPVTVPGLGDARIERVLVSRDGTRLVMLTRERVGGVTRDALRVARVVLSPGGRLLRILPARSLSLPSVAGGSALLDVAWAGPITLAVLVPQSPGVARVVSVGVDGSPPGPEAPESAVTGGRALVGSTDAARSIFAVGGSGLVELGGSVGGPRLPTAGVRSLSYGG